MMNSTSSCMDRYGHYMMRQQQVPQSNFYGYASEWPASDPREQINSCEYDESSISRLAKHTHGAPIIMSSRYRAKPAKFVQPFAQQVRKSNNNNRLSKNSSSDEAHNHDDSGYHANGTCLPRIIKPRKRRKKDKKPVISTTASLENNPPTIPFTFTANQSASGYNMHNTVYMSESFKCPEPPNDGNLFFKPPLQSSTSSSPISLSSSSLSSSTNASSCSCRLCDPNCKIWAFPLRRSFSDNSAVELDHHSVIHDETSRKNVGVIGSNRVKTGETSPKDESAFSILEMIELSHYDDANRLRSESASDSSDSGCDLLLGAFNMQTLKTVDDRMANERLNAITMQLSDFSLHHASKVSSKENKTNLDANECDENLIHNLPILSTVEKSMDFGRECENIDGHLNVTSFNDCNYNGSLLSPMLVHKQNYSLDQNNNFVDDSGLKERTLLYGDSFDVVWQG